ncbi:MAG TPA: 23S rRNA (uracil(1939)-C(5))-methyltransferase RlmD [Candidatus Binatia bacterium]|jgi:23S rRNA (uracil1939-C5)-methyltransferase
MPGRPRRASPTPTAATTDAGRLCPHFPDCPGCPWIDRPYQEQLDAKHEGVTRALRAELGDDAAGAVETVVPAVRQTGYRVQAKHVVARTRSGLTIGLYRPGTHHVADATGCPLHDRLIARTLPVLRDALIRTAAPIHSMSHTSDAARRGVRYALLRASIRERRVLVTLVSSHPSLPQAEGIARALRSALPLAGLLLNTNATAGNVIVGARTRRIWGETELRDRYGDVELSASPVAFVQANTRMAARIYGAIADAAALRGGERVVDLYCGVGGIALTLAPRAREVVAIEAEPAAVRAAQANARRNRRRNVRVEVARVEERRELLGALAPDLVTLNPPRKGCGPAVAAALGDARVPRVLYLSCDPASFARDAAVLVRGGYRLERVRPFDLMPHTEHVELLGEFRLP